MQLRRYVATDHSLAIFWMSLFEMPISLFKCSPWICTRDTIYVFQIQTLKWSRIQLRDWILTTLIKLTFDETNRNRNLQWEMRFKSWMPINRSIIYNIKIRPVHNTTVPMSCRFESFHDKSTAGFVIDWTSQGGNHEIGIRSILSYLKNSIKLTSMELFGQIRISRTLESTFRTGSNCEHFMGSTKAHIQKSISET